MARTFPPMAADERTTLVTWLDFHRETLAKKCAGLSDEQLRQQAVPPSDLSLLGLVRHLTEVEQSWFGIVFRGRADERPYSSEAEPDGALLGDPDGLDGTVDEVFRAWQAACDEAREIVAAASLDDLTPERRGPGGLPALDPGAHGRGVRPPQRPRGSPPANPRRHHRRVTGTVHEVSCAVLGWRNRPRRPTTRLGPSLSKRQSRLHPVTNGKRPRNPTTSPHRHFNKRRSRLHPRCQPDQTRVLR